MHRYKRFKVRKAHNEVLDGIRNTMTALEQRRILFFDTCVRTIEEFGLYSWDDNRQDDAVIKENDHAMDAVRYFVQTKGLMRKNDNVSRIY